MISIRYTHNGNEVEYPIQDSVHYQIQDGAFELWYDMDMGDHPESHCIGTRWNIMPKKVFIRLSDSAGCKEYPITLPAAELMVIMRNYETEQAIASLCAEDLW